MTTYDAAAPDFTDGVPGRSPTIAQRATVRRNSDDGRKTATVDSLTASVRVLMVGSRQVTLSVARQLDEVHLQDIEPFGRVRIRPDESHVIGARVGTGELVVARYQAWRSDIPLHAAAIAQPLIVLAGLK